VEAFVDHHYGDQLGALAGQPAFEALAAVLAQFRAEECAHRDEAREKEPSTDGGPWTALVFKGSALGAALAKRI
jgi:demethoxyubiquinone hydroxylase (CLK1/Coq7/Cat5 family)